MALKQEFIEMLRGMGDSRFDDLPRVLTETSPEVSVRLNPLKWPTATNANEIAANDATANDASANDVHANDVAEGVAAIEGGEPVAWCVNGRYLAERPKFTLDPLMHQGAYYVQDASSMIMTEVARKLAELIAEDEAGEESPENTEESPENAEEREEIGNKSQRPLLWLDACAAPGGKSTAAFDGLPDGSMVVSNEFDYGRAEILAENLAKWGRANSVVTRGDTAQYRRVGEIFDVVAVDAPCSGEGMMRKDPVACEQWTPALVEECAARQREILDNVWQSLRPGGYLVYSTCTFNTTEDESIVRWLTEEYDALPVNLHLPYDIDGAVDADGAPIPAFRFIPGRVRGEGLFLAVVRKPGFSRPKSFAAQEARKKDTRKAAKKGKDLKAGKSGAACDLKGARLWLKNDAAEMFTVSESDGLLRGFPKAWEGLLPLFEAKLRVVSAGVTLAEIKGKDMIPSQHLALSEILAPDAFPQVALSRRQAVDYLARLSVELPASTPTGFVLLTYAGLPLGFVKNIGNRVNNLYPKEWRIKNLPK